LPTNMYNCNDYSVPPSPGLKEVLNLNFNSSWQWCKHMHNNVVLMSEIACMQTQGAGTPILNDQQFWYCLSPRHFLQYLLSAWRWRRFVNIWIGDCLAVVVLRWLSYGGAILGCQLQDKPDMVVSQRESTNCVRCVILLDVSEEVSSGM
jgi:hypothetical protein